MTDLHPLCQPLRPSGQFDRSVSRQSFIRSDIRFGPLDESTGSCRDRFSFVLTSASALWLNRPILVETDFHPFCHPLRPSCRIGRFLSRQIFILSVIRFGPLAESTGSCRDRSSPFLSSASALLPNRPVPVVTDCHPSCHPLRHTLTCIFALIPRSNERLLFCFQT